MELGIHDNIDGSYIVWATNLDGWVLDYAIVEPMVLGWIIVDSNGVFYAGDSNLYVIFMLAGQLLAKKGR